MKSENSPRSFSCSPWYFLAYSLDSFKFAATSSGTLIFGFFSSPLKTVGATALSTAKLFNLIQSSLVLPWNNFSSIFASSLSPHFNKDKSILAGIISGSAACPIF